MPKKTARQKLIDKLDNLVRERLRETSRQKCVTCGRVVGWYHPINNNHGLQVGHYISRDIKQLRWHPKNVAPQCADCNYEHNKNPIPYTNWIIETYGQEILNELNEIRRLAKSQVKPLGVYELQELYDSQNKDN